MMVSFIIPVYNAEKYLDRCLESILHQSSSNWKVVIVNDGSSDDSIEICERYVNIDSRFVLINQENSGVSVARNIGVDNSCDDWLIFVDADDYISYDYVELVEKHAGDADVLLFNYKENGLNTNDDSVEIIEVVNCDQIISLALKDATCTLKINTAMYAPWAKAFRRKIIVDNQLKYTRGMKIGEDLIFNLNVYMFVNKVRYIPMCVYAYTVNDNSALHRYVPDMESVEELFFNELDKVLKTKPKLHYLIYRFAYSGLLSTYRRQVFHPECTLKYFERIKEAKRLLKKEPYAVALKKYPELKSLLKKKDKILISLCRFHCFFILNFIYRQLVIVLNKK